MSTFGAVIKEIRKNRKLTQKMLSEDICSQSVLSRIENDEELPNVVVMQQICQRLGVTMDQIMQLKSQEVLKVTHNFEELANYYRHKKYEEILHYIQDKAIEETIYLDTDWQRYFYYLGSCEFYLNHNYDKTLGYLRKSLSYTYQVNKPNLSSFEIQLLSCLGITCHYLGNCEEAEKHLKQSIHYFYKLPSERINDELIKIFYNYADFLFFHNRLEEAKSYLKDGIECAKSKSSYYYLSDIFELQSKVYLKQDNCFEAKKFQTLSEHVKTIETIQL